MRHGLRLRACRRFGRVREWNTRRSGAPGSRSASPGSAAAGSAGWGSAPARARPTRSASSARRSISGSICSTPPRPTAPSRCSARRCKAVPRDKVVICTKAPFGVSNPNSTPERAVASLDRSLQELGTDYIDVYQLHGVAPRAYDHALRGHRAGAVAREGEGQVPPSRHHRDRAQRSRARDGAARRRDGVWDVAMVAFHMMHQNARASGLSADPGAPGRHAVDVRGAQHLLAARAAGRDDARAGRRRARCRSGWPRTPTRSASWSTTAAPAASSTPPIASCATSPGSMSCCSAPARRRICAATSPRS